MQIPGRLVGPALDALTLNVAILDADGTIVASNRAWQEFGEQNGIRPPADTIGDNYIEICERADDEHARTAARGLRGILSDERESLSFEYPCHSPTEKRWFLMHASRFETNDEYVVVAHENITQRKVAELEAERRNEELHEFARILSHDLRNPLAVAQGSAKMLAMDGEESNYLDDILSSLLRMEAIIDDALTLMQYGTEGRNREPVRLRNVTETAWSNVETGETTLDCLDDRVLDCYPDLVAHIFENLLRNAIEHGGAKTITVGATENGFYVEDDGTGIPEPMRAKVFEMGHTTRKNGTGFGLAIVESLVEAHGWSVDLGRGTDGARFEIKTTPTVPQR